MHPCMHVCTATEEQTDAHARWLLGAPHFIAEVEMVPSKARRRWQVKPYKMMETCDCEVYPRDGPGRRYRQNIKISTWIGCRSNYG